MCGCDWRRVWRTPVWAGFPGGGRCSVWMGHSKKRTEVTSHIRLTSAALSPFLWLALSPRSQKRVGPASVRINPLGAEPLSGDFTCPRHTQHPHRPPALPGHLLHYKPSRRSPDSDNRANQTSQTQGPLESGPTGFPGLPAEASLFSLPSFT